MSDHAKKAHLNTFPPALREKLKYDYIGTLCEGDGEQRTKEVVHSQLKHSILSRSSWILFQASRPRVHSQGMITHEYIPIESLN